MSKKKAAVLLAERECFVNGARERGIDPDAAAELFSDMESFANYAFNKSHAAAYAMISYRTAYLKTHYPHAYFSALLTSVLGNQTKVAEYIGECAARGIRVLPPDINESRMVFSTSGKDIRFGLLALKNVGKNFLDSIFAERKNGRFASFEDFVSRMPADGLNKRMVESLLKAGTFDALGVYRSRLLAVYESLIDRALEKSRNNLDGQIDIFSMMDFDRDPAPKFHYPDIPELGVREKLLMEKEATGMYFSGQMLDEYQSHLETLRVDSIADYVGDECDPVDKARVSFAGIVTSVTLKNTRSGDRMAFFVIEDRLAEIECVAFARQYAQLSYLIRTDSAVLVSGTISVREDEPPKILVNNIELLIDNAHYVRETKRTENVIPDAKGSSVDALCEKSRLFLRVPGAKATLYFKALNLAELFDGNFPIFFYFADEKRYDTVPHGVAMSEYVLKEFRNLLGEENVILK